jgi:hypothetical protein
LKKRGILTLKIKFIILKIIILILIAIPLIFIINNKKNLLEENFELKEMNLFYNLSIKNQQFLNKILKIYHSKEKDIINLHYKTLDYFKTHSLNSNLFILKQRIKTDIFITDDNLTIKNTTFKYDKCLTKINVIL